MRILIIQLARLGDILQTIPTVNAIHRSYPEAEIHLLVRARFKEAAELVPHISRLWVLDSQALFEPVFLNKNLRETQIRARFLINELRDQKFAQILNLSFSPASSYLTYLLSSPGVEIKGYIRHRDGYFHPNDDVSSYVYGQVGIGKSNRVHLTDIFAQVAGVSLSSGDWYTKHQFKKIKSLPEKYVVVHIGASHDSKSYPPLLWGKVIDGISHGLKIPVVTIGAVGEKKVMSEILTHLFGSENVMDLVGKSKFSHLFDIINQAQLLIGADSAPMAIAPFSGTPCLNLSCSSVNFWETGPKSPLSRILFSRQIQDISPEVVIEEAHRMICGLKAQAGTIVTNSEIESFKPDFKMEDDFQWALVKALYMGGELPKVDDDSVVLAMVQLREVNQIIMEQTQMLLRKPEPKLNSNIIERADEIIAGIKNLVPAMGPLINWYEVERIRIPPGNLKDIAERTLKICQGLEHVLSLYLGQFRRPLRRPNENFALESLPDFE